MTLHCKHCGKKEGECALYCIFCGAEQGRCAIVTTYQDDGKTATGDFEKQHIIWRDGKALPVDLLQQAIKENLAAGRDLFNDIRSVKGYRKIMGDAFNRC